MSFKPNGDKGDNYENVNMEMSDEDDIAGNKCESAGQTNLQAKSSEYGTCAEDNEYGGGNGQAVIANEYGGGDGESDEYGGGSARAFQKAGSNEYGGESHETGPLPNKDTSGDDTSKARTEGTIMGGRWASDQEEKADENRRKKSSESSDNCDSGKSGHEKESHRRDEKKSDRKRSRSRERKRSRDRRRSRSPGSRRRSRTPDGKGSRRRSRSPGHRRRSHSGDRDRSHHHRSRHRSRSPRGGRDHHQRPRDRSKEGSARDRSRDRRRAASRERRKVVDPYARNEGGGGRSRDAAGRDSAVNAKLMAMGSGSTVTRGGSSFERRLEHRKNIEEQYKKVEEMGIELPKYYKPGALNPVSYAEQVQKRKMLWKKSTDTPSTDGPAAAPTKAVVSEPQSSRSMGPDNAAGATSYNKWEATNFGDDAANEKFRRLMGIRSAPKPEELSGLVQDAPGRNSMKLMTDLEKSYEVARLQTHKARGVGLGFSDGPFVGGGTANPPVHAPPSLAAEPPAFNQGPAPRGGMINFVKKS